MHNCVLSHRRVCVLSPLTSSAIVKERIWVLLLNIEGIRKNAKEETWHFLEAVSPPPSCFSSLTPKTFFPFAPKLLSNFQCLPTRVSLCLSFFELIPVKTLEDYKNSNSYLAKVSRWKLLYFRHKKGTRLTCIIFSAIHFVIDIHSKLLKQTIIQLSDNRYTDKYV